MGMRSRKMEQNMIAAGNSLMGYLSSRTSDKETKSSDSLLLEALQGNRHESMVYSTRRLDRIARLTEVMP